jgi:hypothetical protein
MAGKKGSGERQNKVTFGKRRNGKAQKSHNKNEIIEGKVGNRFYLPQDHSIFV